MPNTWIVPNIWDGGTVWIIGGGPSLTEQFNIPDEVVQQVRKGEAKPNIYSSYMEVLHDRHVIGVNAAFMIGNWIDMVFFGDKKFYTMYAKQLASFRGLKVTCADYFSNLRGAKENIRYLAKDKQKTWGISPNPKMVGWNSNSGAAAISVAANAKAKRIILLGFDMKLDEKQNQHWHNAYKLKGTSGKKNTLIKLPFKRHLKGFSAIAKDAKSRGIEIINASPDSAIDVFKKMTVEEILNE